MKKVILLIVIIGIGALAYFLLRGKEDQVEMPADTITQRVLSKGEKIDYNINQNNKVVKAIVADKSHSKEKIVARILNLMPLSGQSATVRAMLEQLQNNPDINEEAYQKLEAVVNKYFDENAMRERISNALNEGMSREDLAEVLAWQETPAVAQINQITEQALDPEFAKDVSEELNNFNMDEVTPKRQELLEQLDRATGGTKNTVDNMVLVQASMMEAMMEKKGTPLEQEQLEEIREGMRSSLQDNLVPQARKASAHLFKGVSDETLETSIKGYGTEVNQKFSKIMQDTNREILERFGRAFGGELSEIESP